MGKMSESRKVKKGLIDAPVAPVKRRDLTKAELQEWLELTRLANGEIWKATQIAQNTAIIFDGINLAQQSSDVAKVLLNAKQNWISQTLSLCGVPSGQGVEINGKNGKIKFVESEKGEKKVVPEVKET